MKYRNSNLFKNRMLLLLFMAGIFIQLNAQNIPQAGQYYAEVSGGKIWYNIIGDGNKAPLLMLHGGPGGTCYSLYALSDLCDERPIIFFDQIGSGRSGTMTDTSLMHIEYMVEQLKEFTEALNLENYYLYGHSWGTMLALDFYLKYPEGIKAMILNSPLVSSKMWMCDADTLVATLHDTIQHAIKINEQNATYDSPSYQQAIAVYSGNFIWRNHHVHRTEYDVKRVPGNSLMYMHMWGPSEFNATGNLKTYDRLEQLNKIKIPTLYITGEFDEARPTTVKYYHSLTPNSEFAIIPNAAHASMHDNQKDNINLITNFLEKLD